MGCVARPPQARSPASNLRRAPFHCMLQGSVSVGDTIELPALKLTKQVRSMQMFKRPMAKVRGTPPPALHAALMPVPTALSPQPALRLPSSPNVTSIHTFYVFFPRRVLCRCSRATAWASASRSWTRSWWSAAWCARRAACPRTPLPSLPWRRSGSTRRRCARLPFAPSGQGLHPL